MPDRPRAHWLSLDAFRAGVEEKQDLVDAAVRAAFTCDEVKASPADDRTVDFVISTGRPDRERDVIAVDGWDFRAYKRNPVVLFAHDYATLPVGRATDVRVEDGKLKASVLFVPPETYPFAETVYQMLRGGFLRAASVGFRPTKHSYNDARRGVDFEEQELLEFSVVPVPANADCLVEARAAGVDVEPLRAWAERILAALGARTVDVGRLGAVELEAPGPGVAPRLTASAGGVWRIAWAGGANDAPAAAPAEPAGSCDKGTCPPSPSGYGTAEEGAAWKAPRLADFTATAWDDLTDAERRKIARHYAWVAAMPPEAFADMKLPHHSPDGGDVVWRGVASAMAVLLGARGGVDLPDEDRAKVHRHLAGHYREFDKEPPAMRVYSPDEFAGLESAAEVPAPPARRAPKSYAGFESSGVTTSASGATSAPHVHDYALWVYVDATGSTRFDGGRAFDVADHGHRITAASLARGETEASDGHRHGLLPAGAAAPAAAAVGDVGLETIAYGNPDELDLTAADVIAALREVLAADVRGELTRVMNGALGRVD